MRTFLRILLSVAVALSLLGALSVWGDVGWSTVLETARSLSPTALLTAVGIHLAIYLLRALRFAILLPHASRPPLGRVLAVSAAHNLAAYVLPAKTGEASLVLYLRNLCGVPTAEALASLLVSRLLDLAVLSGGVGVACLCVTGVGEVAAWVRPLGVVLVLGGLVFLFLVTRGDLLVRAFGFLLAVTRIERTRLGAKVRDFSTQAADALQRAGRRWAAGLALSLPLWLLVFLFYAVLARGFGLQVPLAEAAFGSGLAVIANLLPINGFAGFGTQEAGWVVGFAALGVSREQALSTGIGAHLVQLMDVCVFGVLGHLVMGWWKPEVPADSQAG